MKVRKKNENYDYAEHLESAIDEVRQAIDNITYISYPETNQRTIAKLRKALHLMDEALHGCVFKP